MQNLQAREYLLSNSKFLELPDTIRGWILDSPNASTDFADFLLKNGAFDHSQKIAMPYYDPCEPPRIIIDKSTWYAAHQQNSEFIQRELFGSLAHEIGHDRYNTAIVLFRGGPAEDYVKYRSELEAQAIFNSFSIFKDLKDHPDFKKEYPFNSVGYISGALLGKYYAEWLDGVADEATIVNRITALIPDATYTLSTPISDHDGNGRLTHRDLYLEHYKDMVARHPEMAIRQAVSQNYQLDSLDKLIAALDANDRTVLRAERETYFKSDGGYQFLEEVGEYGQAKEREASAYLHHRGLARGSDGHSIGSLTGRRDPRDWDHPDHTLYTAIRHELPLDVSDEAAAHVMLQAKHARILDPRDLDSVNVRNDQAFVIGNNFNHAKVDLSQDPPPMEDTVRQSQQLDQQMAEERALWLAQQQQLARNGPSMSL